MKKPVLKKQTITMKQSTIIKFATGILITLALVVAQSCKDKDPDPVPDPDKKPEITSVSPLEGAAGATVTINGKNFIDDTTGIVVTFRGAVAKLTSSTTAKIVCEVPDITKGDAAIIVTVDDVATAAYTGFEVAEEVVPATITSFTPDNGSHGDVVTITGTNFKTGGNVDKVTINGKPQDIDPTSTDTEIKITLAEKTFSGKVSVWKSGIEYSASNLYNYVEEYEVEDFADVRCFYMAIDTATGNSYVSLDSEGLIIKLSSTGQILDTILKAKNIIYPRGMFMNAENTLYIADGYGRILFLEVGETEIDTLIGLGKDPYLSDNRAWDIIGDNEGFLYVTTGPGRGILKIEISTGSSKEFYMSSDADMATYPIAYFNEMLYLNAYTSILSMDLKGENIDTLLQSSNIPFGGSSAICKHKNGAFYMSMTNGIALVKLIDELNVKNIKTKTDINAISTVYIVEETKNGDLIVGGNDVLKKISIK